MAQIAGERNKAIFCQGAEAWAEQRRTGLPDVPVSIDAAFNEIPSRYTYPTIENSINRTNYEDAVSRQGVDLLTTKIWWNN